MSPKQKKLMHNICGIVCAVLLVLTAVLFAVSCVQIYKSGASPFTRESVAAHFARIAVPVYACIAVVAVSGLLSLIFPAEAERTARRADEEMTLARLRRKGETTPRAEQEEKRRRMLRYAAAAVVAVAAVIPLPLVLNVSRYAEERGSYNDIVLSMVIPVAICAAVALGACIAVSFLCRASVRREIALLRGEDERVVINAAACPIRAFAAQHKAKLLLGLRVLLLVVGIALVIVGVLNGGMADVLGKAINICTECIGLG